MAWSKNLESVPVISQEFIDRWANNTCRIPRRKQKKGYGLFVEGYIHDIEAKFDSMSNQCQIRGKSFPSVKKNDPPYKLMISLTLPESASEIQVTGAICDCKAGRGQCSHCLGLLFSISHFQKLGLRAVPPVQSRTSLPQAWQIPLRTEGLTPQAVDSLTVNKVKTSSEMKTRKRKKKVTEGVIPKVYCPVTPIPHQEFCNDLVNQLSSVNSSAQILKVIHSYQECIVTDSKFGPVPQGSVLSYQQKPVKLTSDIINHLDQMTFPDFILPQQVSIYSTCLTYSGYNVFHGLYMDRSFCLELESLTREQSFNRTWHDVRKHRITSSVFKDVCVRKNDYEKLADRMLNLKPIQTAAMKFGTEEEPKAAKLYSEITSNNVYLSGFVVNPSCPHLGTSPDRKVYDPTSDPNHGLLEIKCPSKTNFSACDFLRKDIRDGTFKLKKSHKYYYQVIGQMGLTGMTWCDFFVKCEDDFHLERVVFDDEKWQDMKCLLDKFYFEYLLPAVCTKLSNIK